MMHNIYTTTGMTHAREREMIDLCERIVRELHGHRLSNSEMIDLIAVVLCNEMRTAKTDCGNKGVEAVLERFMSATTRMIPGLSFQMLAK